MIRVLVRRHYSNDTDYTSEVTVPEDQVLQKARVAIGLAVRSLLDPRGQVRLVTVTLERQAGWRNT